MTSKSSFVYKLRLCLASALLALAVFGTHLQANETSYYLPDGKPDAITLLAPPPLPGSPEQAADLAEVQAVYHGASSGDKAAANSEKKFSAFTFTPVIGDFFQPNNLPMTAAFLERVQKQAVAVIDAAKDFY